MPTSWIALHPSWYAEEISMLTERYPEFRVYEPVLAKGKLWCFGEIKVMPTGGSVTYPVWLLYPEGTPFNSPTVVPLISSPEFDANGLLNTAPVPRHFDHRHQMSDGALCLFQRETRSIAGGGLVRGIDALRRAEQWFLALHTGHWPPDSEDAELEAHSNASGAILLSDVFYSSELDGFGRFYMVPDLRRLNDPDFNKVCPLIATAVTEESGITKAFDARHDLSRIYPWIQQQAWNPVDVIQADAEQNPDSVSGYWWSLPTEPRPFHSGKGLLKELSSMCEDDLDQAWSIVSSKMGAEISTARHHFIGLRYPSRNDGVEWLILVVDRGQRSDAPQIKTEDVKRKEFEDSSVSCIRVHTIRPSDLGLRNTGVVNNSVQAKKVTLIGLGALGSKVAELLAQAGVGTFSLCDSDRLSTGNVARHIGGVNQFGAFKTHIVRSRLLEVNPFLEFPAHSIRNDSAVSSLDELATFIASSDLIISTTADEGVESIINQTAVLQQKPVLYGRALRRGSMGRVFLVRPGKDACKACLTIYASATNESEESPADWIDVVESEEDVLLHECGRPVVAGSAVDLNFVATLTARIALDYLEERDNETNHWLWSRLPAPDVDSRLDREMCTFLGRIGPKSDCYACQEPNVIEMVICDDAMNTIRSLTEASLEIETGGVLIGYVDEYRRAVVLQATGPGPNAEVSKTGFSRDVEYVQDELERAALELGSHAVYIGEWHSHPSHDTRPSSTDKGSLVGIAKAVNYLTRCPVMVIAGLDCQTHQMANLTSWAFPFSGQMYQVPHVNQNL